MATNTMKQRGQAAGLLGVVALFGAAFAFLLTRSPTDAYVLVEGAIGLVGIGLYLATNLSDMGQQFGTRGSFYGATTAIFGVLLVAVLAGVNYIVVKKPRQWDFTKDKIYTLSDQTQSLLRSLKDEVKIRAFYSPLENEHRELEDRIRQYKGFTEKVTLEMLDPSRHRREVEEAHITYGSPRILIKAGARESRAKDPSEESLTNAIAEITRASSKKVYFSKGHGEHAPSDASERGSKVFTENLKGEGFVIDELHLATVKQIPADASCIVVAGPAAAFTEGELKLLKSWVDGGGKLVAFLDPGVQTGLEKLVAEFGIAVGNDEVIDPESQDPEYAIAQEYTDHPVTKARSSARQLPIMLPLARSVSKAPAGPAAWTVVSLARTGRGAWGETEMRRDQPVKFDKGVDTPGPVSLAVAATKGSGDAESRVLVVGNSTFAAGFYPVSGNRDFALNSVSWTAKDESKISIRPVRRAGNLLFLSADQRKGMFLFALNVLPFALLAAGLLVWQSRKSR